MDTYCMQTFCVNANIVLVEREIMNIVKIFADNVRKYRMLKNLSQESFAEECGMHRTYISALECYRRSISLNNIQKISEALEIEPYKLFLE